MEPVRSARSMYGDWYYGRRVKHEPAEPHTRTEQRRKDHQAPPALWRPQFKHHCMATEKAPPTSGKGLHGQILAVHVTVNMTDAANQRARGAAVGQHPSGRTPESDVCIRCNTRMKIGA
jgi:hypothetical protein